MSSTNTMYCIFDAYVIKGTGYMNRNLTTRIRNTQDIFKNSDKQPISSQLCIVIKTFLPISMFSAFREYLSLLQYKTDGVIFTKNLPLKKFGRNYNFLKFKKLTDITLDFQVINYQLHIYNNGTLQSVGAVAQQYPDNTIVECKPDGHGQWVVVGVRSDKAHPNDALTYERTIQNIQEAITLDEITNAFHEH